MLLVNVHELDVIFTDPVALCALKHQVHDIRRIFCLESEDVLVLSAAQDLREGCEVDTERDVAVAAEWGEGFGLEHHRDESDVRVVHGLEGDAGVIAVEIAVLDKVFDGVDDLVCKSVSARADMMLITDLLQELRLFQSCFKHYRWLVVACISSRRKHTFGGTFEVGESLI